MNYIYLPIMYLRPNSPNSIYKLYFKAVKWVQYTMIFKNITFQLTLNYDDDNNNNDNSNKS